MIPSNRWFPTNLPARAAWFLNFNNQFGAVGASLGFTAPEIGSVSDDNIAMEFFADAFNQIKAYESAVVQHRRIITEGDIGEPTPAFPANPAFSFEAGVATGLYERLNDLRERILVAPNYTDEIGALLGILPTTPDSIAPSEVKPTIQVFAGQTGYMFTVVVAERADSNMWEAFVLRKGAANWTSAGSFTGKSADITVTPTTPGDAEQMQVRVQLKKNNQNYGQPSDIVYVTVNP